MPSPILEICIARTVAEWAGRLNRTDLDRVPATEWEARTGYRSHGLTVAALKDRIYTEWKRQEEIRGQRAAARRPAQKPLHDRLHAWRQLRLNTRREFERCAPLLTAQKRGGNARVQIGDMMIRAVEEGEWSDQKYSRSWHRQHGPCWDVSERRVELLRVGRRGALEVEASITIDGFRGHWLVRSIAALLNLPKIRVPRALRPIQMNEHFGVERERALGGVVIYRRMFAGQVVDYCATADGETFHSATRRDALSGLRSKLRAAEAAVAKAVVAEQMKGAELMTAEDGFELGFCEAGMRGFCDLNGLEFGGTYTRSELRAAVSLRKRENVEHWKRELTRIGLL